MIKLNGEYTEEQLLQIIEDNKKAWLDCQLNAEDVRLYRAKEDLMFGMIKFAKFHNEGWKADWKDSNQLKFGLQYSETFYFDVFYGHNPFLFGISVKTKEIAKKMLEEFKEELEIYLQS
mgnify:CR=1 FL=1